MSGKTFYGIWSTESEYHHWIGLGTGKGFFTEHLCIARGTLQAMKGAIRRLRDSKTLQVCQLGDDGLPVGGCND
jgi:hypothetical protein